MTRRHRTLVSAVSVISAVLATLMLAGCNDSGPSSDSGSESGNQVSPGEPATTTPADSDTASSATGEADLPDVCALLSNDEVTSITGRQVDQVDPDDAEPGDATRYCQWQGADLRLAVFLTRITADEFAQESTGDGATAVEGIGEAAFSNAGHLYVLDGDIQIDVYNSGADSVEDAAQAVVVATDLVDKVG